MIFNGKYGRIVGQDHEWVQDVLLVTVEMFRRMGLDTNLEKSNTMFCTPGYIWGKWGDHAYKIRATG